MMYSPKDGGSSSSLPSAMKKRVIIFLFYHFDKPLVEFFFELLIRLFE